MVVDSRGNIFEKQEEEDDLASSSKRIIQNGSKKYVDIKASISTTESNK